MTRAGDKKRSSWRRWALALGMAVLAHAAVLLVPAPQTPEPVAPMRVTLLSPASQPPAARPLDTLPPPEDLRAPSEPPAITQAAAPVSPPLDDAGSVEPEPRDSEPTTARASMAPETVPESVDTHEDIDLRSSHNGGIAVEPETRGPRRTDLFPSRVITELAETTPGTVEEETDEQRVRRRLAQWDGAIAAQNAQPALRVEPGVAAIGERLYSWFSPSEASLQDVGLKPVPWTAVLPSSPLLERLLVGHTDYEGSAAQRAWSASGELATALGRDQSPATVDFAAAYEKADPLTLPILCFGACGQTHDRAELHAILEVDHDELGAPSDWRLVRSSGNGPFDNASLEAANGVALWASRDAIREGRRPRRSVWMFSATAYQWSRLELILDPLFTPSGRELDETSTWAGKSTLDKTVRLIAIVYQKS